MRKRLLAGLAPGLVLLALPAAATADPSETALQTWVTDGEVHRAEMADGAHRNVRRTKGVGRCSQGGVR